MPELPEVETVRRGLNRVTLQQTLVGGDVFLDRSVAYPDRPKDFLAALEGCQFRQWQRRGKYLLAELVRPSGTAGGWLGVHLRMTGQLLWLEPTAPLQVHCRIRLYCQQPPDQPQRELRFVDQRTFGRMWWVPPEVPVAQVITGLQRLGPEPFSEAFSPAYLKQQFHCRQKPIKNALLDQALVAGIGNIYADEALFRSGIRPLTPCSR
ncbi:DNA-formamidopyrimidine glycosylase, partial [filamentous cyanobacterium CCT1]